MRLTALLPFLVFCTFVMTEMAGQQVILNTNGEQIVIYPDGSWRYYEPADSVLLDKNLKKEEMFVQDDDPADPFENPATNPDEIEDLIRLAGEFAEMTAEEQREANIALSNANGDKFELEAQLEQANANKTLVEPDRIASLEDAYAEKTAEVKLARRHLKVVTGFANDAQKILRLPAPRLEKALSKLMVEHSAYFGAVSEPDLATEPGITADERQEKTDLRERTNAPEERSDRRPRMAEDSPFAGYTRAPYECNLIQQPIDRNASESRITVQRGLFFTHTDDELRPYFRQQELVTCHAQLTQIDEKVYLSVEFSIASPNARKNFGALGNGSLLRLTMLNRVEVNLYNIRTDRGRIDPYSGNTLFVGQYLIEKDAIKVLESTELDRVRVVWSTGYEDYDVYELDFLINQFSCLFSVQ